MAEIIGKIFDKVTAEEYYGKVRTSATIETEVLKELLTKTKDYIMIRENNGQVEVLDNKRNPLYPDGLTIKAEEVFNRYSTAVVEELLNKGGEKVCSVEQRHTLSTVSNGDFLLEMSYPCPPYCH